MRILIVTMLDLDKEHNQRTHHVVDMARELADEVTVAYRVRALGSGFRKFLSDVLSYRVTERRHGADRWIAIDPPVNYAQAMAAGLVQADLTKPPGLFRRLLSGTLSTAGIVRDLALVPSMYWSLVRRCREPFDICIAEGPWSMAIARLLRRRGLVGPIVYDDIDFVAGGQMLRLRYAYVAWLERLMSRRADAVVSVGWKLAGFREQTTGRNVIVVPNGVDPKRFEKAHSRPPHPPTLTYVGNIAHYAAVDLAIEAMPDIVAANPGARLLVIGPGDPPYVGGLKDLAASLGVAQSVEFRGPVSYDSVPDILAESDIGLATFRNNPLGDYAFPLKVVEYMAAGLPFMCTLGSESAKILERFPCGKAIEFDRNAFAAAATAILSDRQEYERQRAIALSGVSRFTWQKAMRDLRGVIVAHAV